jgi:hypothetical protein
MPEFVMLTSVDGQPSAACVADKDALMDDIRSACPTVRWLFTRRIPAPYDYMDVFRVSDPAEATTVAEVAREVGRTRVELWTVEEWRAFNVLIRYFG